MEGKNKVKLGTFSNDGLGSNLGQFDNETVKKMQEIVENDLSDIKKDFFNNLKRLEKLIIEKIGSYPDETEFAQWFFDKKRITEWGENLPQITDEEIFKKAIIYTKESESKIKSISLSLNKKLKDKKRNNLSSSIVLEKASYNLSNLVLLFSEDIFRPNTNDEDIRNVFSYPLVKPKGNLSLKINNKKFVFLLQKMGEANIIESTSIFDIINDLKCFKSERSTILKRPNLDGAKSQLKSTPLSSQTEDEIEQIVKKIKKQ